MKTTYPQSKLYFQFLRPQNISGTKIVEFKDLLSRHGFIELVETDQDFRYTETDKLTDRANRDELFKLIGSLK